MQHIESPKSDDPLERHRFYASVSSQISYLEHIDSRHHETIRRVHDRLDDQTEKINNIDSKITNTETRNRTMAAAVVVTWTLISGFFGWIWDKSSSKIDHYIQKIEEIDRRDADFQRDRQELQSIPALKRQVQRLQDIVDSHEAEKLSKESK